MPAASNAAKARAVVIFGTLVYTAVTFAWAVLWHVVLFRRFYESLGYIDSDPNFAAGFLSILMQGAILSWLFLRARFRGGAVMRGLKFALAAGGFYWTCHVLAFAAKNDAANAPLFYLLETIYLLVQFGVFGVVVGKIYRKFFADDIRPG